MTQPELEPAHIGQFVCPYDTLRALLGLPEHVRICDVENSPFALYGGSSVRILVEDVTNLSEVLPGQEVPSISPQFKVGGDTFREFQGWTDGEEAADSSDGREVQPGD